MVSRTRWIDYKKEVDGWIFLVEGFLSLLDVVSVALSYKNC